MTHELKIIPKYFEDVLDGKKNFELRKDDRNFKEGDNILLREYEGGEYTGYELFSPIRYILRDVSEYGLQDGFVILGLDSNVIASQAQALQQTRMEDTFTKMLESEDDPYGNGV